LKGFAQMAGIGILDEQVHARTQEYVQLVLHEEWGNQDDLQHEGTFNPLSIRHQTRILYRDHSDEHEAFHQEFSGN